MQKEILDRALANVTAEEFDQNAEKSAILCHPKIAELIITLKLNQKQIDNGMNYLQKYYNFLTKNSKEPDWKIYVNLDGQLDIDFSNEISFRKQNMYNNFWLTQITPLDNDLETYFAIPSKQKPRKILTEAEQKMQLFSPALKNTIQLITAKESKGLFLVDDSFAASRAIFKYLATLFATNKNKTVAYIDANSLYKFLSNNYYKKPSQSESLIEKYLLEVDYLFIERLGVGLKPEWFITFLISIFSEREINHKINFVSSPIDISGNYPLILNLGQHYNAGAEKVETLFKNILKTSFVKFIAKNK
ncbi:Uncharacterised protein [Metamycoplasma arthritidis]|uniref:Uncharacterized protein n=1 Tax=Metamycoplasma arthritidis (strain 158L3-1) TaxID=243272 RepID=B3PN00_META1|nr:hypothetical protein [Metamycoplasma arthritidis]ACF07402.1 hypothetical protein MARTH_orf616 [Metamycoplasma arthritidis 158L3-1]VEU78924.1 Uncharacterised protein [Metamycoplasma arthritidis]